MINVILNVITMSNFSIALLPATAGDKALLHLSIVLIGFYTIPCMAFYPSLVCVISFHICAFAPLHIYKLHFVPTSTVQIELSRESMFGILIEHYWNFYGTLMEL